MSLPDMPKTKRSRPERREHARARAFKPPKVVAGSTLSREQRVALFGAAGPDEAEIAVTLTSAATGLALLATQHLAQRLMAKRGSSKLTAKDQIALKLAPQFSAEGKKKFPGGGDQPPPRPTGGGDPLMQLLDNDDTPCQQEATVRIETGR